MAKEKIPGTQAIRLLKQHRVDFISHNYKYEDKGGTATSSRELGVAEHLMVKTLIMEDENSQPLIILMHGDCEVSQKQLARKIGCKQVTPCTHDKADRLTGYQTGGISPFGTRQQLPTYMEQTIQDLPRLFINGGKRGFLVEIAPADLIRVLQPTPVSVAICQR
jgi:Cys-tRNA(Pro) deacylase